MKRAWSRKNLWDRSPRWVRATAGRALGVVPFPWILGARFRRTYAFLQEAQWWDEKRARQYQAEQLRRIARLAYDKSAYYRRQFDEAGFNPDDLRSPDDLRALPTIDRHVVKANLEAMCTRPADDPDVDFISTGGTGGEPLYFYAAAARSAIEYAYLMAGWSRVGFRPGMTMAVLRGRVIEPDPSGFRHEFDPLFRHHHYSNFDMNEANMALYVHHMRGIGPCVLHAYPSSAETLARFMQRAGVAPPNNIRAILLESENLADSQIAYLENVFKGSRVLSCYGHSEKLVLAAQCEKNRDYHVWPTYGYFELLDESGRPVEEAGKRGEIVGTGFINTVTPMIRYRTGDFATLAGRGGCPCGREHIRLNPIEGRWPAGSLVARDGSLITMTALNLHDDTLVGVTRYRFYQERPGEAVLRVVPARRPLNGELERMKSVLEERVRSAIRFTVEAVENIPLTARGKCELVEQRIKGARGD